MYLENSTNLIAWIVKISKDAAIHCTVCIAHCADCNFTSFDYSCNICNIITVIKSLIINNQKRRKFYNLLMQCKTYPNSWKFSWILGYQPCFYTACMLFTFCYHNRNVLSSRIVICQNSNNCSGLRLPVIFTESWSSFSLCGVLLQG